MNPMENEKEVYYALADKFNMLFLTKGLGWAVENPRESVAFLDFLEASTKEIVEKKMGVSAWLCKMQLAVLEPHTSIGESVILYPTYVEVELTPTREGDALDIAVSWETSIEWLGTEDGLSVLDAYFAVVAHMLAYSAKLRGEAFFTSVKIKNSVEVVD